MNDIQAEISKDRRAFIKKVLKGTIAGSLFLVIPAGAMDIPEQITGMMEENGPDGCAFIGGADECVTTVGQLGALLKTLQTEMPACGDFLWVKANAVILDG